MGEMDRAICKYQNDPISNRIVSTLLAALMDKIITVDDLRLSLKLAIFKYDQEQIKEAHDSKRINR